MGPWLSSERQAFTLSLSLSTSQNGRHLLAVYLQSRHWVLLQADVQSAQLQICNCRSAKQFLQDKVAWLYGINDLCKRMTSWPLTAFCKLRCWWAVQAYEKMETECKQAQKLVAAIKEDNARLVRELRIAKNLAAFDQLSMKGFKAHVKTLNAVAACRPR